MIATTILKLSLKERLKILLTGNLIITIKNILKIKKEKEK